MNLTPMNSDELNTQSDVYQELSKDTMLEKIILYVVAYFCVGTEIRFQATKMEKMLKHIALGHSMLDALLRDKDLLTQKRLHIKCTTAAIWAIG